MGFLDFYDKWKNYKTYKKLQNLWADYKKSLSLKPNDQSLVILNEFLDSCKKSLQVVMQNQENQGKIQEIFVDCDDLVAQLMNYVKVSNGGGHDQSVLVDDMAFKVLEVLGVIMKDRKYKKQLESSQVVLCDLLSLLDKVKKSESKVLLIKLMIVMSEQNQSKQAFLRNEGISKLVT